MLCTIVYWCSLTAVDDNVSLRAWNSIPVPESTRFICPGWSISIHESHISRKIGRFVILSCDKNSPTRPNSREMVTCTSSSTQKRVGLWASCNKPESGGLWASCNKPESGGLWASCNKPESASYFLQIRSFKLLVEAPLSFWVKSWKASRLGVNRDGCACKSTHK